MITIERKIHFAQGRRSRKELRHGDATGTIPAGRISRLSRLMALAIRFDMLIRDGIVADQAELARLGNVTRARVTQIMNLLLLAPDLQEEILFLPCLKRGRASLRIQQLQPITSIPDWRNQRLAWTRLRDEAYDVLPAKQADMIYRW